jgi:hypothetical protein
MLDEGRPPRFFRSTAHGGYSAASDNFRADEGSPYDDMKSSTGALTASQSK